MFPTKTVGAPGTQGAGVTGTQGIGVSAPKAAAVAAATVGFAMDIHTPKGGTFIMGFPSMMFPAGFPVMTRLIGRTFSVAGAAPKLHLSMPVAQVHCPIRVPPHPFANPGS
jgi:hypothetical protein